MTTSDSDRELLTEYYQRAKERHDAYTMKDRPFDVWIICTRGTVHSWRKMTTCDNYQQAALLVEYHRMIDVKFPKGYYAYKIEPAMGDQNAELDRRNKQ